MLQKIDQMKVKMVGFSEFLVMLVISLKMIPEETKKYYLF